MNSPAINTVNYQQYLKEIPKSGRHILAQQSQTQILVYQAYNHQIADYAIQHQEFGGPDYSYSRMSWIKPNFLWMMYRCGWASKVNQERVLGIWIKTADFEQVLSQSVFSSFSKEQYTSHENWKAALETKPVRLQWDPDHDIHGQKQERKTIQLGIKGTLLAQFGKEMVQEVIDLTEFVKVQKAKVDQGQLSELLVPSESVFIPKSDAIRKQIGLVDQQHYLLPPE